MFGEQTKGCDMTISATTGSTVDRVREHLCSKGLYGDVAELCEMRGDCCYVITCPDCKRTFTLDDDEYDELLAWSRSSGQACGVAL
jgi:hypothetical protein